MIKSSRNTELTRLALFYRVFAIFLMAFVALPGCRAAPATQAAGDVAIDLRLPSGAPRVGQGELTVRLMTTDGAPIPDATVTARGDMTHAGMIPVLVTLRPAVSTGDYEGAFDWTMAGDWIVTVTATMADGRSVARQFPVTVASD
jgi:hypothetical protein